MAVALRAVRVLLPWGVLTEPQGRAGKKGSFWEPLGRPKGVLRGDLGALGATEGHFGTLERPFFHTTSS